MKPTLMKELIEELVIWDLLPSQIVNPALATLLLPQFKSKLVGQTRPELIHAFDMLFTSVIHSG